MCYYFCHCEGHTTFSEMVVRIMIYKKVVDALNMHVYYENGFYSIAFRRCNITAANSMCTNSGDRNLPQGNPIGGSQTPGTGNGGSTSSAQSSNGGSQSYTQSSQPQAKFSEG